MFNNGQAINLVNRKNKTKTKTEKQKIHTVLLINLISCIGKIFFSYHGGKSTLPCLNAHVLPPQTNCIVNLYVYSFVFCFSTRSKERNK